MNRMSAGAYIFRAIKHLVKMAVLVAIIYFLMDATDTLAINQNELLGTRGIVLMVALVLLSAAYPAYGFVERITIGSLQSDRDLIVESMLKGGYSLQRESNHELVFRATSPFRRLIAMGDDAICIRDLGVGAQGEEFISISGLRKGAVEAEFRISGRLRIKREENI